MRFGATEWLWGLALIPVVWAILIAAQRRRLKLAARFADADSWSRLTGGDIPLARRWKYVLLTASIMLLVIALARPQWGARTVMLERRGLDIVLALDVSKSMLAADVKPNRLARAKREISAIFDHLAGDRVGLVVFAGDAFVQFPLTIDASAARLLLSAVDTRSAGRPGTVLTEAITTGAKMFEEDDRQFKVLILITDGEGHEGDPIEAAQEAAEQGIRIYTVGIGTPAGEPVPVIGEESGQREGFKKDSDGQVVLSKLDEVTLQKIALATDGQYYRASPAQMEVDELFADLATLEKKELEGRLFTEFEERFQYFLLPAFLLMALEFVLPTARRRREQVTNWDEAERS
jgi:Ca-activated chloride channel family protein